MQYKILNRIRAGTATVLLLFGINAYLFAQTSVLTQHNDIARTGQNLNETILTPAKVGSGKFGKLFPLPVDGDVLAQPLYVSQLSIGGAIRNVVFIATEHDSVYAFDADSGTLLWQASLLTAAHGATAGATSEPASDTGCLDVPVEYGITGTPVIDPVSGTMYLVAETFENGYPLQRLHALDITSGAEKPGSPVVIKATVAGTGSASIGGVVAFDPKWENQRAGLLLADGNVYIGWGAHCDFGPFHGWLMAYSATTLAQTGVVMTTPNGEGSGIWMAGSGLAADVEGGATRLFVATGNGSYDASVPYMTNLADYGDDILRLSLTNGLTVTDAFTPKDQAIRQTSDTDLGSGGVLLLPDQPGPYPHLLVQTGKGSEIYLVNRDNLGGYSTTSNNVVQELDGQDTYLWGMPAYWNGNVYMWTGQDSLKQFSLTNGLLSQTPIATGLNIPTTGEGATPSISANGTSNAILWVVDWSVSPEILYAVDATNVSRTIWSSAMNSARDSAGPNVKYPIPTIANGKVYVASTGEINVYGILGTPNFELSSAASTVSVDTGATNTDTINVTILDGFAGQVTLSALNLPAGTSVSFSPDLTSASSIATFSAAGNAIPGTYPITIAGTSGSLTHSATVSLQVVGVPNFALSASPSSVAMQQGTNASSVIGVASINGFSGSLSLSVNGLPTGVTAAFSAINATSYKLTLTASPTAWVGNFPVVVTGTAGALTHSVSVSLSVTRGLNLTGVQLVNNATGACFDVNSISKSAGAEIGQASCWGGANQLWNLSSLSNGAYQFTSINSGLVLDISASSALSGALAIQNTNNLLASQQWKLQKTSDAYFNLVNVNSGKCLDGVESSLSTGDETQQQTCSAAASQKWSLVPLSNTTQVNLAPWYNVDAISVNGQNTGAGGIDGGGDAFAQATLGSSLNWFGFSFVFGQPSVPDAVTSTTVALPNGEYNGLYLLALASDGSRPNQTFLVNYSDGTATTIVQGLHDWGPQTTLYPGEQIALTVPYRLLANGLEDVRPFNIYGYHFALDSTRTAVSVTLPNNVNVTVMAITLGK